MNFIYSLDLEKRLSSNFEEVLKLIQEDAFWNNVGEGIKKTYTGIKKIVKRADERSRKTWLWNCSSRYGFRLYFNTKYHTQSLYKISFWKLLSNIVYIAHIANNKCNIMLFCKLITFSEFFFTFLERKTAKSFIGWMYESSFFSNSKSLCKANKTF